MVANSPGFGSPIVDPKTGTITSVWYNFFRNLTNSLGDYATIQGATGKPVVVGGSPFTFTATIAGYLVVSGGGISAMSIIRSGSGNTAIGGFYGSFPMRNGDKMQIIFPFAAPQVTFFPDA